MKVFVNGTVGLRGYDCVKELIKNSYAVNGSGGRRRESVDMKVFVTGVGGQLGHDVMDEIAKRGYEGIGSDILESINTKYPYVQLDITDAAAVEKAISEVKPDVRPLPQHDPLH